MPPQIEKKIRPEANRDIEELNRKIDEFKDGKIPEDKFKHFRLTRGVYGQRQLGVQMIRIKIPHGRFNTAQLLKMADISDKYATGNLHLTTRQDIQLHYVKLEDSPQLWAELEEENITLRAACGNTVRNVTGSASAGIDPDELFDITPYAEAFTQYFLRNPICQDMGRKFKAAFSSSDKDSAFTYFHDLGFTPRVKVVDGKEVRGFKVVIGGGLGAQTIVAQEVYAFLEEDKFIPFSEAVIRVFDRHGERTKRFKARMKFLIRKIGLEEFMKLVEQEKTALKNQTYKVDQGIVEPVEMPQDITTPEVEIHDEKKYEQWLATNTFEQKQKGYHGVYLRIQTGDISSETSRLLAEIVRKYAADDIRVTVNQGLLLRFVKKDLLPAVFTELDRIGLAEPGFDTIHDITACPGSDTCNLAVTNSTGLTRALESVLKEEYEDLIYESNLHIKISGCMNACGQHMAANIGFHGSSIKNGSLVAPAMQVVLGGGVDPDGAGFGADKVIKLPSKKAPEALRMLLTDYEQKALDGEYFNHYYRRLGKMHFYQLLKPLTDLGLLEDSDYIDWEQDGNFQPEIGVGECAGITLDVVGTVIKEAEEKLSLAQEGLEENIYADSIYNCYTSMVIGAKAILLSKDIECNTQANIISEFNEHLVKSGEIKLDSDFGTLIYQINKVEPSEEFAEQYFHDAQRFHRQIISYREKQIQIDKAQTGKKIIKDYYKA